ERQRIRRSLHTGQGAAPRAESTHHRHSGLLLLPLPALSDHGTVRQSRAADQAVDRALRPHATADGNRNPTSLADLRQGSEEDARILAHSPQLAIRSSEASYRSAAGLAHIAGSKPDRPLGSAG